VYSPYDTYTVPILSIHTNHKYSLDHAYSITGIAVVGLFMGHDYSITGIDVVGLFMGHAYSITGIAVVGLFMVIQ
jgi:hypothetical protein